MIQLLFQLRECSAKGGIHQQLIWCFSSELFYTWAVKTNPVVPLSQINLVELHFEFLICLVNLHILTIQAKTSNLN